MSDSLITKKALAQSIKALMSTKPLSKITINEIVTHCGVNRQTFYYHFKDKYDLVNWIYYREAIESLGDCKDYPHWSDGMLKTLVYLMENKAFITNALKAPGQNTFYGYFYDMTYELIIGVINDLSKDMNIFPEDKSFIADFYTHAFTGVTIQWVKSGMKNTPEEMVEKLKDIVEGSLMGALSRYKNIQEQPFSTV